MARPILNVLHTKCFENPTTEHDAVSAITGQFMIASRSGISKLWSLYLVRAETSPNTLRAEAYNFTPVEKEMETADALTTLNDFEREKEHEGYIARTGFTYTGASHFKDAAPHHGFVFELDTGKAIKLENAAVPAQGGMFDPSEITDASGIYASVLQQMQQERSENSPDAFSTLFRHDTPPRVNLTSYFNTLNAQTLFAEYGEAFNACAEYVHKIIRDKSIISDREYSRRERILVNSRFDVTSKHGIFTENNYGKAFKKAYSHATAQLKTLKPHLDDSTHQFLDEHLTALDLARQITCLQIKFSDQIKNGKTVSAKEFTNGCKKIMSGTPLSDEMKAQLEILALDFGMPHIEQAINAIRGNIKRYSNLVERQFIQYKKETLQGAIDNPPSTAGIFAHSKRQMRKN